MALNHGCLPPRDIGTATVGPICTNDFGSRSRGSRLSSPLSSSLAMTIPGSQWDSEVPPALPPPRFPPINGMPHGRDRQGSGTSPSQANSFDERQSCRTRDHAHRQEIDEGYHSVGSARTLSSPRFGMHHAYQFRAAPDSGIDNFMLSKLNNRRPTETRSPPRWPSLGSPASETASARASPKQLPKLVSLPDRTRQHHRPILDSPSRYTQTPVFSTTSPRHNPFHQAYSAVSDYRSPASTEGGDYDRFQPKSRRTDSVSVADDVTISTQGSHDARDEEADYIMEDVRVHRFDMDDAMRERERERGQKRRASSPAGDEMLLASDHFRRREGTCLSRGSLTPIPQSSVSSVSSAGRSGTSYISMATASSMTSAGSYGRRSPRGRSPVSPSDYENIHVQGVVGMSAMSPQSSITRGTAQHQHEQQQQQKQQQQRGRVDMPSSDSIRTVGNLQRNHTDTTQVNGNGVTAKLQGFFMCECCPKKPKKFETQEELSAHEAEKQYECSFCGNRFKNKNEAERHQNSLHVRRHSWSCSALTGYERAFHESAARPGEADICGYCGEEFARTGASGGALSQGLHGGGRFISDQDWEERVRHLQDLHKFRECNSSKKFFRADHFRQHLKHSHAGTSGKWTNMLENACMIEEEPPVPIIRRG